MEWLFISARGIPLKTVDSQGGFISTEWILDKGELNKRCQIKINITSRNLLALELKLKSYAKKDGDEWYTEKEILVEEEKNHFRVLEKAQELSIAKDLSKNSSKMKSKICSRCFHIHRETFT